MPTQSKTVDVMLSMTPEGARKWLRLRAIPFSHMRALSGGGTAFRIRRGYVTDFRHYLTMDERARVRPARNRAPSRARVTAKGRRARPRKRNPLPRGSELRDTFTLSSLKAVKRGGRAEKIWYQDARDNKHYYHDFESEHGAIMYLCESAALGKCVLIVSGDLSTPLWENA